MRTYMRDMFGKNISAGEFIENLLETYPKIKYQIRAYNFAVPQDFFDDMLRYTEFPKFIGAYTQTIVFPIPLNYQSLIGLEMYYRDLKQSSVQIILPDKVVVTNPKILDDEYRLFYLYSSKKITFEEYVMLTNAFLIKGEQK